MQLFPLQAIGKPYYFEVDERSGCEQIVAAAVISSFPYIASKTFAVADMGQVHDKVLFNLLGMAAQEDD